jgi:dTMP kinase
MTPVLEHPRCTRGPLISIEGVTGVGKTYLTRRALELLDSDLLLLDEFSARTTAHSDLGAALLRCLRDASAGDPFLRGGTPMAEALILLAIKRHDLDSVVPGLVRGRAVIEGRGVDSTAVCQAALIHPDDPDAALATATALLDLASSFRPLADCTILVTDDAGRAIERAQQRDRCVFTDEQTAFMRAVSTLFERVAATDPARFRVVDRRTVGEHEAADLIQGWVRSAGADLECVREPWQDPPAPCMYCGRPPKAVVA